MEHFKVVVVGDGAVGKTSLLITYVTGKFPVDYIPTICDSYTHTALYNDKAYGIGLWDTAGEEDYDRLRPLSYPGTHVFLICFSVIEPASLERIASKWIPELSYHCPNVPIIIVGTKIDLRDDENIIERLKKLNLEIVSHSQGLEFARRHGAEVYYECSARTGKGVNTLFERVLSTVLEPKPIYQNKE